MTREIKPDGEEKLPHARDESPEPPHEDGQHHENRKPMEQAHRDVKAGILDTERIGTPNDVPGGPAQQKQG